MNIKEILKRLEHTHGSIVGMTGSGKSYLLVAFADELAKNPLAGFTFICKHGTTRLVAERLAHPASPYRGRAVHVFDPGSNMVVGISPFETYDESWAAAHQAALLWSSSVASLYATAMHDTPRLEKNFYVLGMFAAVKKLTLLELLEALSLGAGARVREFLLADFDNAPTRRELEDLHYLATKQPGRFLELTESCRNRLVRWLSDKRLARIFGRRKGLDARAVMDDRDIVLVDLSALDGDDADCVATVLVCRYFTAAKRREPNASARHFLIIDEAAGALCKSTASLLDETRKFGLHGIFSLQRRGQLLEKGQFISDALMVNTGVKILFAQPEPEFARFFAEQFYTGWLDLEEWKPRSARPTAIGNQPVILRNRSRGTSTARHRAAALVDIQASSSGLSSASGFSNAVGDGSSFGHSDSVLSTPAGGLLTVPTDLSQTLGDNRARTSSAVAARSHSNSFSAQSSRARARTTMRGESFASSIAEGESEAFVTQFEDLPTSMFPLEEQIHKASARIMNLKHRQVIVKYVGDPPFLTRTPDLKDPFDGPALKAEILPRYLASCAQRSPYLVPAAEVDAEIAARMAGLASDRTRPSENFTTPEPMPDASMVDDAESYARQFLKRVPSATDVPPAPPSPPPGRKPVGELGPEHERFRVVDGDKSDGDN